jgi:hypothetical protein
LLGREEFRFQNPKWASVKYSKNLNQITNIN